jgi:hypothetical protein
MLRGGSATPLLVHLSSPAIPVLLGAVRRRLAVPSSQDVLTPQPYWLCLYVPANERQTTKSSSPWQAFLVLSLNPILLMAAGPERARHLGNRASRYDWGPDREQFRRLRHDGGTIPSKLCH